MFLFAALHALPPPANLNPPGTHTPARRCPEAMAGRMMAGPRPHCRGCRHRLHPGVSAPEPRSAGNIGFGPIRRSANEEEWLGIPNGPRACPVFDTSVVHAGACCAEALKGGRGPG